MLQEITNEHGVRYWQEINADGLNLGQVYSANLPDLRFEAYFLPPGTGIASHRCATKEEGAAWIREQYAGYLAKAQPTRAGEG